MEMVIKIPDEEFGIDIDDKFKDFFSRLKVEIKEHLITDTSLVCGPYELKTIDMFLKAFNDSVPLPEHHGRIVDESKINNVFCYTEEVINNNIKCINTGITHTDAPTIIEGE